MVIYRIPIHFDLDVQTFHVVLYFQSLPRRSKSSASVGGKTWSAKEYRRALLVKRKDDMVSLQKITQQKGILRVFISTSRN